MPLTSAKAHPRSRGENTVAALALHGNAGSSPLTRGKPANSVSQIGRRGLIPAHAGKTCVPIRRGHPGRAHPRSRGENMVSDGKVSLEDGSSPLTRGKPDGVQTPVV